MSYKISFYGDRKPEVLPDERGKLLYEDWQKGELPERVEIRTGLTVERRAFKEIEYIREAQPVMQLSDEAIRQFERDKLTPFLNDKGQLTFDAELKFLESEGVIRVHRNVPVAITQSDVEMTVVSHLITAYEQIKFRLSQWRTKQNKREYARRMEKIEYEKIAHTM